MIRTTLLVSILIVAIALSSTNAFAAEAVIFSEELPPGALLDELRADSLFTITSENPYAGSNHLKRDIALGGWGWITGISSMNLDLTDIDFDKAFVEFYIDSGAIAIGYMELRIAGPGWEPDNGTEITVDDAPGYERISVMLKDFNGSQLGRNPANMDEFTGGTGKIDTWSVGFGAEGDLLVDEIRISDGESSLVSAEVSAEHKLAVTWGKLKSR